ncbi:MAG TPA: hypothetical protein VL400_01765, partial [Polyangiaceae bacterium]|nr:hypothetical protein [Polyangiaceae bacterium]
MTLARQPRAALESEAPHDPTPSPGALEPAVSDGSARDPRPIDLLVREASSGRSGEFIFATSDLEVHVFLQRGRVAWATDSSRPFEFTRFLRARCRIEDEMFREVLEECRRSRRPLGQTLVAWELSTWDDVRASLRHQLCLALGSLAESPLGASMFLSRTRFGDYDERLTFDLAELMCDDGHDERSGRISSAPAPSPSIEPPPDHAPQPAPAAALDTPSPEAGAPRPTASELLDVIKDASWVLVAGAGDSEPATRGASPEIPVGLAETTLGDGADFVALRSSDGALFGSRIDAGAGALWCRLGSDSAFGAALAALSSRGLLRVVSRRSSHATPEPRAWKAGGFDPSWLADVEQVFAYGRDVLAVALVSPDGHVVAGMSRNDIDEETCTEIVERRAPIFAIQPAPPGALESLGFRSRRVVTGEARVWCFGAEAL